MRERSELAATALTWIVLNDAAYNMCEQGMSLLGYQHIDAKIPPADLAAVARAMGAQGVRVTREAELAAALVHARTCSGPLAVDVLIDPTARAQFDARVQSLAAQGAALPNGASI